MKKLLFILIIFGLFNTIVSYGQNVHIDGRLKPHLDRFLELCEARNINYHEKLFKLKTIDIVDTLSVSPQGSALGMLTRNQNNAVEHIIINWIAMLDQEILKVVAYHEFAHYFLEYEGHVCDDCGKIMSIVNTSYFDIVTDWDNQIKILFDEAPILKKRKAIAYLDME